MIEFLVDVVAAFRLFRGRTVGFTKDEDGCDAKKEGFGKGVGAVFDGSGGGVRNECRTSAGTYLVSDKGRM